MTGSIKATAERLRSAAAAQQGFFTAAQARDAGYLDAVHGYHVDNGDWEKIYRGIYRLADFPPADWPALVIWSLWSRDREGRPQGVYSHATARMIHGLQPRAEGPLHMTVPKSFRKNCELPPQLILHKEDLDEAMVEPRPGYRVVKLSAPPAAGGRSYHDVIQAGED